MSAPFDSPPDPETGRVIDPEVLAEHRARRAELTEEGLLERSERAERTIAALELRLAEAEDRDVIAQRERGELETDVDAVVRGLKEETARLRTEHRAAEGRAAELTRTLVRAHAEVDGARTRAQVVREEAERTLAVERERAAAEVTLLRRELVRRTSVHDAVAAQLAELHGALEAVRARADAEGDRTRSSDRAAEAAAGQLRLLREEAEGHNAARREAEAMVEAVRAWAASLEGELEEERGRRAPLEARLVAAGNELHSALARAEGAEAARRVVEAELAERLRLEEPMREVLEALHGELEEARHERASRAEREAGVERLVADLVATARGLRAGFATALAGTEERVAGLREQLVVAVRQLRTQLEDEQTARRGVEAELAREMAERAAAERRAAVALDALNVEAERVRAQKRGNPVYDALSSGPLVPPPDHPALVGFEEASASEGPKPPTVIADLMRAAARLRADAEEPGLKPVGEAGDTDVACEPEPAVEPEPAAGLAPVPDAMPEPESELAAEHATDAPPQRQPLALRPPDRGDSPERATQSAPPVTAAAPDAPAAQPWLGPALDALDAVDAASAERVLVAALCVQASRVAQDVAYDLVLPATGRHHVRVRRHHDVVIATASDAENEDAEFRLEGAVAALAPLVAGAARRRLRGVRFRGRRRRLGRLLRALKAPVGLGELRAAGARPRPGDLLALLCLSVPAAEVQGADFGVAYVVRDVDGRRVRTLVRAEPDGSLTAIPEAPDIFAADATVTVDADELLGVLTGSVPVFPDGDAQAVATLQRWLRRVQGLPA